MTNHGRKKARAERLNRARELRSVLGRWVDTYAGEGSPRLLIDAEDVLVNWLEQEARLARRAALAEKRKREPQS